MTKILIGLALIFAAVNIHGINYTPAWVGYVLIFLGLRESWSAPSLSGSRAVALGAAAVSGALWVAGLLGYGTRVPVGEALQVWMTYRLLRWCEERENWDWGYRVQRLRQAWYALAGANVAAFVLGLANPMLWLVWALVALVAGVYYIYTLYRLSRMG